MKNRLKLDLDQLKNTIASTRITKTEIAQAIGVSRETFSRWLGGRVEYIEEDKLLRLSQVLGCEPFMLSPELQGRVLSISLVRSGQDLIAGDDFLRLAFHSGLWRETTLLCQQARNPELVQDFDANLKFVQALDALINLDFSQRDRWGRGPDLKHGQYEVFDVLARYECLQGIYQLSHGFVLVALKSFRRVIIQASSPWLVSLAYLLTGFCQLLLNSDEVAAETWRRGLQTFPEEQDDLNLIIQNQITLALLVTEAPSDQDTNLNGWQTVLKSLPHWCQTRRLAYEALLHKRSGHHPLAAQSVQDVLSSLHRQPRMFRFESLLLLTHVARIDHKWEEATQYLEMASDLAQNNLVLQLMIARARIQLYPDDRRIAGDLAFYLEKCRHEPATVKSRKVE